MKNRLRELRSKKGYDQKELAKKAGCGSTMVGLWERGEQIPSIKHGLALAEIYGVTLDYLYIGVADQKNHYLNGAGFVLRDVTPDEADEILQCLDMIKQNDETHFNSFYREITMIGHKLMRESIYSN